MIEFWIPVKTVIEANRAAWSHDGAQATAARKRGQKEAGYNLTRAMLSANPSFKFADEVAGFGPVQIRLIRVAHIKRPADDDNLPTAMKAIRDGIAKALGFDDGNRKAYQWTYDQETTQADHYAVKVMIFCDYRSAGARRELYDIEGRTKKLEKKALKKLEPKRRQSRKLGEGKGYGTQS